MTLSLYDRGGLRAVVSFAIRAKTSSDCSLRHNQRNMAAGTECFSQLPSAVISTVDRPLGAPSLVTRDQLLFIQN
jgi:hypothetical protein